MLPTIEARDAPPVAHLGRPTLPRAPSKLDPVAAASRATRWLVFSRQTRRQPDIQSRGRASLRFGWFAAFALERQPLALTYDIDEFVLRHQPNWLVAKLKANGSRCCVSLGVNGTRLLSVYLYSFNAAIGGAQVQGGR